jgi:hypothetical protein
MLPTEKQHILPSYIITHPLLHTHLSPYAEMYDIPDQAAHFQTLSTDIEAFVSNSGLYLKSKRDDFLLPSYDTSRHRY